MEIGIIGQGFVGNAVYQKFKEGFNVLTYDMDYNKCNSTFNEVIYNCEYIFMCLPTPMGRDGRCNTEIVEDMLGKISHYADKDKIIILKSTVPPKFTKTQNAIFNNLNVIFNPEFLTAVNAVKDFATQKWAILGGDEVHTAKAAVLYQKVFPGLTIKFCDSDIAEMSKYIINTFLATKVAYANEIYEYCQSIGLDYSKAIEHVLLDDRVGKSHWQVPGPDGHMGFGGACFPKDINALIYEFSQRHRKSDILNAVWAKNLKVRTNNEGKLIP